MPNVTPTLDAAQLAQLADVRAAVVVVAAHLSALDALSVTERADVADIDGDVSGYVEAGDVETALYVSRFILRWLVRRAASLAPLFAPTLSQRAA